MHTPGHPGHGPGFGPNFFLVFQSLAQPNSNAHSTPWPASSLGARGSPNPRRCRLSALAVASRSTHAGPPHAPPLPASAPRHRPRPPASSPPRALGRDAKWQAAGGTPGLPPPAPALPGPLAGGSGKEGGASGPAGRHRPPHQAPP
jgi:hypothetical protein